MIGASGLEDAAPAAGTENRPDFLIHTRLAFAAAANASAVEAIELCLGEHRVRLRVAGPLLAAQLRRAYHTLIADDAAPCGGDRLALTIDAWDREHTGVGCPGVPYAPEAAGALGGGLVTQFGRAAVIRFERANAVSALDRARTELFHCVRSAGDTGTFACRAQAHGSRRCPTCWCAAGCPARTQPARRASDAARRCWRRCGRTCGG